MHRTVSGAEPKSGRSQSFGMRASKRVMRQLAPADSSFVEKPNATGNSCKGPSWAVRGAAANSSVSQSPSTSSFRVFNPYRFKSPEKNSAERRPSTNRVRPTSLAFNSPQEADPSSLLFSTPTMSPVIAEEEDVPLDDVQIDRFYGPSPIILSKPMAPYLDTFYSARVTEKGTSTSVADDTVDTAATEHDQAKAQGSPVAVKPVTIPQKVDTRFGDLHSPSPPSSSTALEVARRSASASITTKEGANVAASTAPVLLDSNSYVELPGSSLGKLVASELRREQEGNQKQQQQDQQQQQQRGNSSPSLSPSRRVCLSQGRETRVGVDARVLVDYITELEHERSSLLVSLETAEEDRRKAENRQIELQRHLNNVILLNVTDEGESRGRSSKSSLPISQSPSATSATRSGKRLTNSGVVEETKSQALLSVSSRGVEEATHQSSTPRERKSTTTDRKSTQTATTTEVQTVEIRCADESDPLPHDRSVMPTPYRVSKSVAVQADVTSDAESPAHRESTLLRGVNTSRLLHSGLPFIDEAPAESHETVMPPKTADKKGPRILISPLPTPTDEVLKEMQRLQASLQRIGDRVETTEALLLMSQSQQQVMMNRSTTSNTPLPLPPPYSGVEYHGVYTGLRPPTPSPPNSMSVIGRHEDMPQWETNAHNTYSGNPSLFYRPGDDREEFSAAQPFFGRSSSVASRTSSIGIPTVPAYQGSTRYVSARYPAGTASHTGTAPLSRWRGSDTSSSSHHQYPYTASHWNTSSSTYHRRLVSPRRDEATPVHTPDLSFAHADRTMRSGSIHHDVGAHFVPTLNLAPPMSGSSLFALVQSSNAEHHEDASSFSGGFARSPSPRINELLSPRRDMASSQEQHNNSVQPQQHQQQQHQTMTSISPPSSLGSDADSHSVLEATQTPPPNLQRIDPDNDAAFKQWLASPSHNSSRQRTASVSPHSNRSSGDQGARSVQVSPPPQLTLLRGDSVHHSGSKTKQQRPTTDELKTPPRAHHSGNSEDGLITPLGPLVVPTATSGDDSINSQSPLHPSSRFGIALPTEMHVLL